MFLFSVSAGLPLSCSSSSTSDDMNSSDASVQDSSAEADAQNGDGDRKDANDGEVGPLIDGGQDSGMEGGKDAGLEKDGDPDDDGSILDVAEEPEETIRCPKGSTEVFRDDFDGSEVDESKWNVVDQGIGGGTFTQKTYMRRENVKVQDGNLVVSSWRHCENPRSNRNAPIHESRCPGTGDNYYSGAWLKVKGGYAAGGKGSVGFRAKMPKPVPGSFPALWARNTEGGDLYTELDLIEMTWDRPKNVPAAPDTFVVTTHFGAGAKYHAKGPAVGPFQGLTDSFHVWEVQWDAGTSPAIVRYYYRDTADSPPQLLRETTVASSGFAGNVKETDFAEALRKAFRPYVDFAVLPETTWSVSPDAAEIYAPDDLLVDCVIVCQY
ncbi:MAG TPA: hypothetical protein PKL73_17940 [Polyangiaceae bacterium]|jgi:hypothetical protein|nr:hypothetical protein [Polyangiaceae bacterium]HNZ25481.1 hypothetical protein [Polyangiaceae bacterium]HOD25556.1 hypothetical protein [Polyangiaceae bacterium]HOE51467.1 hypothetical protein [Polyangiaceae bacterium]HOH03714.1 hypothetical protein [Polyangiaceae bacterium]